MDDYYYATYVTKIISRAFHYSVTSIGGASQIVLNVILFLYYFLQRPKSPPEFTDIKLGIVILFAVFSLKNLAIYNTSMGNTRHCKELR